MSSNPDVRCAKPHLRSATIEMFLERQTRMRALWAPAIEGTLPNPTLLQPPGSQREATEVNKTSSTNTASVEGSKMQLLFQQQAILANFAAAVKQHFQFLWNAAKDHYKEFGERCEWCLDKIPLPANAGQLSQPSAAR